MWNTTQGFLIFRSLHTRCLLTEGTEVMIGDIHSLTILKCILTFISSKVSFIIFLVDCLANIFTISLLSSLIKFFIKLTAKELFFRDFWRLFAVIFHWMYYILLWVFPFSTLTTISSIFFQYSFDNSYYHYHNKLFYQLCFSSQQSRKKR